jgi:hypothetical protein
MILMEAEDGQYLAIQRRPPWRDWVLIPNVRIESDGYLLRFSDPRFFGGGPADRIPAGRHRRNLGRVLPGG